MLDASLLLNQVCGRLQKRGLLRPLGLSSAAQCARPPLRSERSAWGEPLGEYLKVPCRLPPDAYPVIFDEYVEAFILTSSYRVAPTYWLLDQCEIQGSDRRHLFRPTSAGAKTHGVARLQMGAQLLQLAAWNIPGANLEVSPWTTALTLPGKKAIGFQGGSVLLTREKRDIGARVSHCARGLESYRVCSSLGAPAGFGAIYKVIQDLVKVGDISPADLNLIFSILFWRISKKDLASRFEFEFEGGADTPARVDWCRVTEFEKEPDPLWFLYRSLVPAVMKSQEFMRAFSNPHQRRKPTPKSIQKWAKSLQLVQDAAVITTTDGSSEREEGEDGTVC